MRLFCRSGIDHYNPMGHRNPPNAVRNHHEPRRPGGLQTAAEQRHPSGLNLTGTNDILHSARGSTSRRKSAMSMQSAMFPRNAITSPSPSTMRNWAATPNGYAGRCAQPAEAVQRGIRACRGAALQRHADRPAEGYAENRAGKERRKRKSSTILPRGLDRKGKRPDKRLTLAETYRAWGKVRRAFYNSDKPITKETLLPISARR